ncbi:hypothetical protein GCK72_012200 [Caenorhabditis remanei]|uniref:Uncharacterized protein n=1 Tax=Caenorhabditis remanei TaxID=31234 RepID=A0A6A5GKE2_CAERE|nr:hypothetical protein GCK72_012200 [Caenorhabditis remanei]KAF1755750.1 hypothetical protein GCK72_012200 [Caenorhabditis remanei]
MSFCLKYLKYPTSPNSICNSIPTWNDGWYGNTKTQLYRNSKNGVIPKFRNEALVTYFFLIAGAFLTVVSYYFNIAIQIAALCLFVSYATSILVISLDKFYLLYNAISDLYAGINPYLLWIFSDSLRKYILIRIGFRKKKKGPSSSVLTVVVH